MSIMPQHHFISYSTAEALDFACHLHDALESGTPKIEAWLDKRDLKDGIDFDTQIHGAIRDCVTLLFVMTPDSVSDTSFAYDEWSLALKHKKPVIPLLLKPCEAPFRLQNRQYIDFSSDFDAGIARLREHLRWMDSPAGQLQAMRDRLKDAERDLRRVKEDVERKRIENEIALLREDIKRQQELKKYKQADNAVIRSASTIDAPVLLPRIVNPYLLLKTKTGFVGRHDKLKQLNDWILTPENVNPTSVFVIVSIGGNGKSALAWHWFNQVAPRVYNWAGRLWWCFYGDAEALSYSRFITEAFCYVTGKPVRCDPQTGEAPKKSLEGYERQLLDALKQHPFLIVLDGFERLLNAYRVGQQTGFQDDVSSTENIAKKLRRTSDYRFESLLQELATINTSRILITSRLFPEIIETPTSQPINGCFRDELHGLSDDDALKLWHSFEVSGSRDRLLALFRSFGNHPLLIQALANVVARDRETPRNFDGWLENHHDFKLQKDLSLRQKKGHILEAILNTLDEHENVLLSYIAAARTPINYDILLTLLVGPQKPFDQPDDLDEWLTHLEDRGLVGWDQERNSYDLHPIVRAIVWERLSTLERSRIRDHLFEYFRHQPSVDWLDLHTLEDLMPSIELFNSQIDQGSFDAAYETFEKRLREQVTWRLGLSELLVELVERFFPDGVERPPRLTDTDARNDAVFRLGIARLISGHPKTASTVFQQLCQHNRIEEINASALCWLSDALRRCGSLYEAERTARRALMISRELRHEYLEATSLYRFGLALTIRGEHDKGRAALTRSRDFWIKIGDFQQEGLVCDYLAESLLSSNQLDLAADLAKRAWELAPMTHFQADFIRSARVQGLVAMANSDLDTAKRFLHNALRPAQEGGLVEEELPIIISLAHLHLLCSDLEQSQELLYDVVARAQVGPYPTYHADALNVLAQLELKQDNPKGASETANRVFEIAWCDGEPFSYETGLATARRLLLQLGQSVPNLAPFNQALFELLPEVTIDWEFPEGLADTRI
jgi:tetratricopeptide (TPR) repeat protein